MIKIDESVRELLLENSVHREIILRFPEDDIPDIGSDNIIEESFELVQSICDEEKLVLGGGIAGQMTVNVIDVAQELSGKRVNVYIRQKYSKGLLVPSKSLLPSKSLKLGSQAETVEYQLFSGTIFSVKKQKNRSIKEVVAYDDLYAFSNIIISLNALTSNAAYNTNQTLYSFIQLMLELSEKEYTVYHDATAYFNDAQKMNWHLSSVYSSLKNGASLLDLLTAYSELNAGFAKIDRTGKLRIGSLSQYGDNRTSIQPKDVDEEIEYYYDLTFEDFVTKPINYIRFSYMDNLKFSYGSTFDNSCYVSENIILRMCDDVRDIVCNFLNHNFNLNFIFHNLLSYRPYQANVFARWWLEPGDRIRIKTGYDDVQTVDSFIFSRTIKGINGMRVIIKAKGQEYIGKKEVEVTND